MNLDLDDLSVESFATVNMMYSESDRCCTGCDSGCGYFPTNGGCQSSDADSAI